MVVVMVNGCAEGWLGRRMAWKAGWREAGGARTEVSALDRRLQAWDCVRRRLDGRKWMKSLGVLAVMVCVW